MQTNTNMNSKLNIRTYGCSFTSYMTGTYADILNCGHRVVNCAKPGCGNAYIKYTLFKDYKLGLLENADLVILQWSSFSRWNYKSAKQWLGLDGSIFNTYNKESRKVLKYVKPFYNNDYEKEMFINDIIATKGFFESKNIPHKILSYEKSDLDFVDIDDMANSYRGNYVFDNGKDWIKHPFVDTHPTLESHLKIASQLAPVTNKAKFIVKKLHAEITDTKTFRDYFLDFTNRNITAGC